MTKRDLRTTAQGRGTLVPMRSGGAARKALLAGTALGCSILVMAAALPGRALAANECGALTTVGTTDSVTCNTGSYPTGITYTAVPGHTLDVGFINDPTVVSTGQGLTTTNTNGAIAVHGGVTITGVGRAISATATNGAITTNTTGNLTATSTTGIATGEWLSSYGTGAGISATVTGDVKAQVTGNFSAYGVRAATGGGSTITVNGNVTATTTGNSSLAAGVWEKSTGAGAVDIQVNGSITVVGGNNVYGVRVTDTAVANQLVNVAVQDITVSTLKNGGSQSAGVSVSSKGVNTISAGNITASGNSVLGVFVSGAFASTDVTVGNVSTNGANAVGIQVKQANPGTPTIHGDITIHSGAVTTLGNTSRGIYARSYYGNISVTADGPVKTSGVGSSGVKVFTYYGDTSVTSSYVRTTGTNLGSNFSTGITAISEFGGNASVHSGTVITSGYGSYGIQTRADGSTDVTSDYISTTGGGAKGIWAYGYHGATTVQSGVVKTTGDHYAMAIRAYSHDLGVTVTSDYASTTGDERANAIWAVGGAGAGVHITSGVAKTQGYLSSAIIGQSIFESVYITSGHVETSGKYSTGIFAVANYGTTNVDSQYVATNGDHAYGITALSAGAHHQSTGYFYAGYDSEVTSGTVITRGDGSTGIFAQTRYGNSIIHSGSVDTWGDYSNGIYVNSGVLSDVTSDTVVTQGDHSAGITALSTHSIALVHSGDVTTAGDYSGGIVASTYYGSGVYSTGTVTTAGDHSTGIAAASLASGAYYTGQLVVDSNIVSTAGAYSAGISAFDAAGYVKVYSSLVTTTGDNSAGIVAQTLYGGDITVVSGDVFTAGAGSDAIVAETGLSGGVTVTNLGQVYAAQGAGVRLNVAGAAAITNYGMMYGAQGTIVGAAAGGLTLDNQGMVFGAAHITSAGTAVQNSGAWEAFGDSQFGGGGVFNNTGLVVIEPFASTATTTTWTGLATFNNSDTVALDNGHTGDVFTLAGAAFKGSGASTLSVDASLGGGLATDKLVVGAASGSTQLAVHDIAPNAPATLNVTGVTVVQASSGSASNFTWAGAHKGFVDYQLAFDGSAHTWNIVSLPGQAAFEMLKAPAAGQSFWQRSADAWTGREQVVRDDKSADRGRGWELWGQVLAGGETSDHAESFSIGGSSLTPDLSMKSRWTGMQAGGDYQISPNLLVGVTAGYLSQRSTFTEGGDRFDVRGFNLGAYAGYGKGRFFADGLVKADWYGIDADLRTVRDQQSFSGNTLGVKGEAGFRLISGKRLWLEPVVDLSWTRTSLLDAGFGSQDAAFSYGDANSLRAAIGARAGGQWRTLRPYVGLHLGEQSGTNSMTMLTGLSQQCGGACAATVEDQKPGAFTRLDFGLSSTTGWHGFNWYLTGQADLSGHTTGTGAQLGLRKRW